MRCSVAFPALTEQPRARIASGQVVPLGRTPSHMLRDISHSSTSAALAVDSGKMDRFGRLPGAWQDGANIALSQLHQSEIADYWRYAHTFALDDRFFSTIMGPSFPEPPDNGGSNLW